MGFRRDETKHDSLILYAVKKLKQAGARNICADLPHYPQPNRIYWEQTGEGHIPDASARLGTYQYLVEAETEDTISIEHTRSQWTLFSANAKQHGKIFVVVVPSGSEDEARLQLRAWRLTGEVW